MVSDPETIPPRAKRIGIQEFREKFSGYMRQVRNGDSFIVTSGDEVVAVIRPPPAVARSPRQPGALRGRIRMVPDFDTLPADVLASMEDDGVQC